MITIDDIQFYQLRKPRWKKVRLSKIYRKKIKQHYQFLEKQNKIKESSILNHHPITQTF